MKKILGVFNRDQTAEYLVYFKISPAVEAFTHAECVSGNREAALKAETRKILGERLLSSLLRKGAVLTCQDCGKRGHDVKIVEDFHAAGALCPACLKKRTEYQ